MLTARVEVLLKLGVADPEGDNTLKALNLLGFDKVTSVRSVKVFELELDVEGEAEAERMLKEMCERLLANPVIHDYSIQFLQSHAA